MFVEGRDIWGRKEEVFEVCNDDLVVQMPLLCVATVVANEIQRETLIQLLLPTQKRKGVPPWHLLTLPGLTYTLGVSSVLPHKEIQIQT